VNEGVDELVEVVELINVGSFLEQAGLVEGNEEGGLALVGRGVVGEVLEGEVLVAGGELEEVLVGVRAKCGLVLGPHVVRRVAAALRDVLRRRQPRVVVQGHDLVVLHVDHRALAVCQLLPDVPLQDVLVAPYSVCVRRGQGVRLEQLKLRVRDRLRALHVRPQLQEVLEIGAFCRVD
jgi:hypothetical protein